LCLQTQYISWKNRLTGPTPYVKLRLIREISKSLFSSTPEIFLKAKSTLGVIFSILQLLLFKFVYYIIYVKIYTHGQAINLDIIT
ncbi:MAG: hypothetical protein MRQ12_01010, partial [Candidatus Midichloria mitochondrii]|nr:hypothetical protein [Candidatus Midichloria mitochondrii]